MERFLCSAFQLDTLGFIVVSFSKLFIIVNKTHFVVFSFFFSNHNDFIKSPINRHSRESGSPEPNEITGFPLSRE